VHIPKIAALLLAAAGLPWAHAQQASPTPADGYPSRPITMVVPMAAGGTADLVARAIGPALSAALGQGVVIDNRVGANGAIGEYFISRAKPDGYTVMLESTSVATNPGMGPLPFDPRHAFAPVMQLVSVPLVMVVNANVKAQTTGEFLALAHQQPGKLNYSSGGIGNIAHFAGEIFKIAGKADMAHVPYKSAAQALTEVLAGTVDAGFPTLPLALQQLKTGKIRALALMSAKRSPMAPDMPTMAESGLPGVEVETWFGVFFPAGTPTPVIGRMQAALDKVLATPEIRANLQDQGFRIVGGTPADFSKFYLSEIDRYERVVKQANMKAE
jgi:tripartite-type tricarboxylate transporter receptor subunit TctC